MERNDVSELLLQLSSGDVNSTPQLIETHISWVILCKCFAYKIKKPIQYPFLDFSTVERRKYYCEKEVELNQRLTDDLYLDVQTIARKDGHIVINSQDGEVIDHAVRMRRLDGSRQMDVLLSKNRVTEPDIRKLAERIADFHRNTLVIPEKDTMDIRDKFRDLETESVYLTEHLGRELSRIIPDSITMSDRFMVKYKPLLDSRLKKGFYRDCHGDLHTRNIFLLSIPQAFDCIEFNDDYRQIDTLNDVAFLCMDLEASGRKDLSDLFITYYNARFPSIASEEERKLFLYYKSYRANIRAKVNSLRARNIEDNDQRKSFLAETAKYLRLMKSYAKDIDS